MTIYNGVMFSCFVTNISEMCDYQPTNRNNIFDIEPEEVNYENTCSLYNLCCVEIGNLGLLTLSGLRGGPILSLLLIPFV